MVALPKPEFDTQMLAVDELLAVLPPGHALASLQTVPVRALAEHPFVMTQAGSQPVIARMFTQAGVRPRVVHELTQILSILEFVRRGQGISVLASLVLPLGCEGVVSAHPPHLDAPAGAGLPERAAPVAGRARPLEPGARNHPRRALAHARGARSGAGRHLRPMTALSRAHDLGRQPSMTRRDAVSSAASPFAEGDRMPGINPRSYDTVAPRRLAFLGLGVMGYPMAGHLVQAGHSVTVYNRSPAKAEAWLAEFGQVRGPQGRVQVAAAPTPREAVANAELVLACVGNDDDLRGVTLGCPTEGGERADDGAFAGMREGAIFIDHTTASADVARELAARALERGCRFIDAPVSGGQAGAVNGVLTVMCGGNAEAYASALPVMQAFARSVALMGDSGAGQLTKMVNQICIAGLVQGLAEGIAFGQRAGLDLTQVLEVIGKGAAQSWQMDNRGRTMAEGRFDFGFAVDWMRKDLGLVLAEARRNGARVPVTALVDQFYGDVQREGGARWDTSSLITRLR